MKRSGLGRGLDVLLPPNDDEVVSSTIREIDIDDIDPNTAQPRRVFEKESLAQLAQSISEAGILSPILVIENGMRFQIVAGERRFRAARMAGLTTIPCIVREMSTPQQMESALIENIQREDLNPIEEATAIKHLMQECQYTQEQVAKKLGKSRPVVTNALRLLTLPDEVMTLVLSGDLSAGHARVLVGVEDPSRQIELAQQCVLLGHSVRKLEELAKATPSIKKTAQPKMLAPELSTLQNAMREALGVKTTVQGNEKKGKITLAYHSAQELEHLYDMIGKLLS